MVTILMSGSTEILKKLVGVSEDIGSALGVRDDLKKLQSTAEMILAVIPHAEKRQEKEELARLWLIRLKDIAYDIDDVIDEISYEDMRRSSKHEVINFLTSSNPSLTFLQKMSEKIKKINKRFDEITKDMGSLQLEFTTPIPDGESTEQLDRPDTSHINESQIVGREDDEFKIIKLLTTHTTSSSSSTPSFPEHNQYPENVSVISIVGIGGLGKTTLAQLVYKDKLVKKVFEVTMWAHVSDVFNIEIILANIMQSLTLTKFHSPSKFHVMVDRVQGKLKGKKYLLVLDDLWIEDREQWERLKSVLLVGAPGSKILITTRKRQVADAVRGSIPPYNLNQLQDDACWSIIKQKAFSPGGGLDAPKMSDIGKEIAKKCCGLPLAAKFLGSLMHLQNKESDWISIRDDDVWNTPQSEREILPALKLSYSNLPSHLKQCFSYCSIFPKNWEISKETLVQLWMAEGFLKQSDIRNKKSTEDFGREYFESLAWSSFFHDFKKNDLGGIETCKMHDLVHDLAKDVLGENELASLKTSDKDVSEVRRLRIDLDEDTSSSLKCLSNAKKLRTLFISDWPQLNPYILPENNHLRVLYLGGRAAFLDYLRLPSLRYLRLTSLDFFEVENDQSIGELYNLETLIMNNMRGAQDLLSNIQSLQKLRYFEVSSCWNMVELPDSVTNLYNLQTLDLNHCSLKFIPDSIAGLKNLRFLNLSFNPIEELPLSVLTLSNLETLDVNTCKNLRALPTKVADLVNLRIFDFKNCPLLEALPKDFGALTQLRSLNLEGTQIKVLPDSCTNLKNLEFVNLSFCELPKEVTNWTKLRKFYHGYNEAPSPLGIGKLVFLQNLSYKVREKVFNGDGIEELANLNFLETLNIGNLEKVKDPEDAKRANLKGKQNLHQLYLGWGSGRWSEIEEKLKGGEDLARQLVSYWNGMLRTMRWDQKSCNFQVFEALQPPSSMKTLHINNFMGSNFPTWMRVPSGLPNLVKLTLENCFGLEHLPAAIGKIPGLRALHLEGVSLMSLDIGGFPSLIRLELNDILPLKELYCSSPSCLQDLRIESCNWLTEIPSFPSLTYLELKGVNPKLVFSVEKSQTSLTKLWLENIYGLVYFPTGILQKNRNLQSLCIDSCKQLEGFRVNEDEIENESSKLHIGSLRILAIFVCPVLKLLPDLRGWTSLQKLIIICCPQLKESLAYLKDLTFDVDDLVLEYDSDDGPGLQCMPKELQVNFNQNDEQRRDPSSSLFNDTLPLSTEVKNDLAIWIKELLYSSLGEGTEKFMFEVETEQERPHSKNKWGPTLEQESVLELLEKCGLLSPTVQQIEEITKQLSDYGKVQDRDVYGWFLNKAEQGTERASSSLNPMSKEEGLKYHNTGKLLPISYEKQREFLPSVEETIEVWASHYVRPNIVYVGELDPHIRSDQPETSLPDQPETSLPTVSSSGNLNQGVESRPEGQLNMESGDPKKGKLYGLFPWLQRR